MHFRELAAAVMTLALLGGMPAQAQDTPTQSAAVADTPANNVPNANAPKQGEQHGNLIAELRTVVENARVKLENEVLEQLRQGIADWRQVEKRYDEAIAELDQIIKRMGPGGDFDKEIDNLIKLASEESEKLAVDELEELRKLAEDYKKDIETLKEDKKRLAQIYADLMRRQRYFQERKRVMVAFAKRQIFEKAVDVVQKGLEGMEEFDDDLAQIQARVDALRKKIAVAQ